MKTIANDLRTGHIIEHKDSLWHVVKCQHVKPGKGGAFVQSELKNLYDNSKLNERFRSSETVTKVRLEQKEHQYLYKNEDMLVFMDNESYEQIELPGSMLGDKATLLQENCPVVIEVYNAKPLRITLPAHMTYRVEQTEPNVKGQTAASSNKPAILENSLRVMVPPFIDTGDAIVLDTQTMLYLRRAEA